ncbi:MAG: helix-turn-helix domain-containing protein [Candidatus Izemoplasmataceae bacterium]
MTNNIYPKTNLKIIGKRFKNYRVQKGYSLRGIARSENVTPTLISEIETGKIYPNVETIERLYNHVDISLNTNMTYLADMKEHIELFNEAVYYQDTPKIEEQYGLLEKEQVNLKHSLLYVDYCLSYFSYQSAIMKNYSLSEIIDLEEHYDYFSEEQKQKFNLIKGVNLYKSKRIKDAINYLERNLHIYANERIYAVTITYLAFAYDKTFQIHNAIHYAKLSSDIHGEYANLQRKIATDLVYIKNLIEANRFHDANQTLNNLEITLNFDNHNQNVAFINQSHFLRSYILYRQKHFQEALDVLSTYGINDTAYMQYYKARIYMRLNDKDNAIKVLENSLDQKHNDFVYSRLNKLFLLCILEEYHHPDYERLIDELLENPLNLEDFNHYRFVVNIANDYYFITKQYDKAKNLTKQYIEHARFL